MWRYDAKSPRVRTPLISRLPFPLWQGTDVRFCFHAFTLRY